MEQQVHPIAARLGACVLAALVLTSISSAIAPAHAQVLYGSIVGRVTDPQGATVPGATVTIVHRDTNLTREATTDNGGSYSLVNVLPGAYDVKVALGGFREVLRSNVPVTVGQISRVDVTLDVGQLTETVTVPSSQQLLQTDKADVSTELKSAEITSLPLNRYRNYQALVNLVPGSTPVAFQNAETDTPQQSLNSNVNGQTVWNNATRTDGAANVNVFLTNNNMYVSPAETIDTVNVSTSSFDAEQGMAGGAAITVVTKSGTNQFKGSAFAFFNDESLNASPFFFGSAAAKPDKLPVQRTIYGGTLGGPVRRDRVFFFGSYEGYRSSTDLFTFFNVPDAALRNGDFSNARNANGTPQVIYDPMTGNPDGTGRVPFQNNVIPSDRIHPIARRLLDLYPLPNTGGVGAGGLTSNFQRSESRTTRRHNVDGKVNWNRTAAHQIWGKVSYMDASVDDLTNYLGPDPAADGDGGLTNVWQLTAGQTWTLSPTLILDSTFGFSRQDQEVLGPDFQAGNFGLDVLGIPGTNDQGTGDPRYAGFPQFITGFSDLGNRDGWNPIFRDYRTYSVAANVTKVRGRHELRAGFTSTFLYMDQWQPDQDNPRGKFTFATNATALRGGDAGNFYNQYASFLLGLVGTASKSVQHELMTAREWQHGLFIRDRWTVHPQLTVDLGLRWEYFPIMRRADRGVERIDLETLDVLLGGRGGNPDHLGLEAAKDNFAPRVGLVYRVNEQTVARAGYGLTNNPQPWARPMKGLYPVTIVASFLNNEPFAFFNTIDQGIPFIAGPDLSTGRVPLPATAEGRTPEIGNVDHGTIQSWNLAVERRMPLDLALDLAYVGAKGDGGYADLDINAPQEIGTGNAGRPFADRGRFIPLRSWGRRLKTRYHGLQVALNRPFTGGLLVKGAYTWSKSMNQQDGEGDGLMVFNTLSQYDRNYALAGFDRTHNLQLAAVYQLPWRSNGTFGSPARIFIDDWQINAVFGAFSGTPFTVTANPAVVNTPGNQQTADQVGEAQGSGEVGARGTYYDPGAWAQPTGVRFGTSGRNSTRGPGGVNLDLSLFRAFPLGATRQLEFRLEATNVTNTPKFANPNADVTSGSFMRITNTLLAYPERQVRLGLRFSF